MRSQFRYSKRQYKPVYDTKGRRLLAKDLAELVKGAWEHDRSVEETVRVEAGQRVLREVRGGE